MKSIALDIAVIIIAADDDHQTPGNPGMTKARAAVQATGAKLAVPMFKATTSGTT